MNSKEKDDLAEKLQVEVMEDYIRDACELSEGIIKNTELRIHFTKLVDWIAEREDKIKNSYENQSKNNNKKLRTRREEKKLGIFSS